MLERMMRHIHNRFDADGSGRPYGSISGTFRVEDGRLEADGIADGRYFWVEGSALNDGLHRYPAEGMEDEEFTGRLVLLSVPKALVELADEAEEWCEANGDAISSPFQSESFGGYSYTKAAAQSGSASLGGEGWQERYAPRLRQWRKLSSDWQ